MHLVSEFYHSVWNLALISRCLHLFYVLIVYGCLLLTKLVNPSLLATHLWVQNNQAGQLLPIKLKLPKRRSRYK